MENKSVIHFGTANRTDHHILTKRTLKDKFVKRTTDVNTNFSNEQPKPKSSGIACKYKLPHLRLRMCYIANQIRMVPVSHALNNHLANSLFPLSFFLF